MGIAATGFCHPGGILQLFCRQDQQFLWLPAAAARSLQQIASRRIIFNSQIKSVRTLQEKEKNIKIDIAYSADNIWSGDTYEGSQHKHQRLLHFIEADKTIGSFVPCRGRSVVHQIQVPSKRKRIGLPAEVSRFD
jgi:hypothetical protein